MKKIEKILQSLALAGAKTYYVGGCVRDELLNIENKDIDIEIHNVSEKTFIKIMLALNIHMDFVGESFGVYKTKLDGYEYDFSFPRTEVKTGDKHTDFEIIVDPFIGEYEASLRRDFTINALMKNTQTGEILDFHGGINDLNNGIIRHTSDKFSEDGLRIYRAAQFAARFDFKIDDSTKKLFVSELVKNLAIERVQMELEKVIYKAKKPSVFFNHLPDEILTVHFNNITNIKNIICNALDNLVQYKDNKFYKLAFFTILSMSFDKKSNLIINEKQIVKFINNFDYNNLLKLLLNEDYKLYDVFKYIDNNGYAGILILKSFTPNLELKYDSEFRRYNNIIQNLVSGKDLIVLGYNPDAKFSQVINKMKDNLFKGIAHPFALNNAIETVYEVNSNDN